MVAEIICVGTEILMGNIVNTNAAFLAEQCASMGLSMYHQTVVGDNPGRLAELVNQAMHRSDILIFSGGLGPTQDDLTKETIAKAFGLPMVEDPHSMERLKGYFAKANRPMTENNLKQAFIPKGSIAIDNHNGTAPGIIIEGEQATAILLPGPPNELIPMFLNQVIPYLQKKNHRCFFSNMVKISGTGESAAETKILDLINGQTNPTIATYAKSGEVHIRVTGSGKNTEEAQAIVTPVVEEICKRFGNEVFTLKEEEQLEDVIVSLLREKKETVSFAESCTGGLLAGRFVNASGASEVFKSSFITYSNDEKARLLGVSEESLEQYGAVSEQVAQQMAIGCAKVSGVDYAIAVTGIAGPNGGTESKPVGLVYISCYAKGRCETIELHLRGNRAKIREVSVARALRMLREEILKSEDE